jgi:hypothetical protein
MHTRQRIVFGNMGGPRQEEILGPCDDPDYLHNTLILEMSNNWPWVRWLMDRRDHGDLKRVDPLEKDWLTFIEGNNIDVEKYGKDSDQFLNEWFKNKELTDE